MTIPLPHTVGLRAWSSGGLDDHENEIDVYATAVDKTAFYWSPSSTEPLVAGHDRVVVDWVVVLDSATVVNPKDHIVVDGTECAVIGEVEDFDHGPWWVPGRKPLNVREVTG